MRDTKENRLLLVLLVAVAFALITVDIRGGDQSPLNGARNVVAAVLGPVESGASSVVSPVGATVRAVRDAGSHQARLRRLQQENMMLRQHLASADLTRSRTAQLDRLLRLAGAGQYSIKAAQVIAIGAAQGFSWTITIDAGSDDGIARDMTVVNGEGLVGRVTTVGPTTATVLLASDPDFTVGTRVEGSGEIGFASGQGDRPMKVQLLDGKAPVHRGDRMVTFGSEHGRPFVPGVPVGRVTKVEANAGQLTKTVLVQPFVSFTRLDLVGVVVEGPRTDPRDAVLPPRPKPSVTASPAPAAGQASPSASASASPRTTGSPSPQESLPAGLPPATPVPSGSTTTATGRNN